MVPGSTRSASTLGQRALWNCRLARLAVDRARCVGGHRTVCDPAVADVDHELSWATPSTGPNRRFTRNAYFVQCVWVRHHSFPLSPLGAPRTEQYRKYGRWHDWPETFPRAGDRRRAHRSAEWTAAPVLPDRHIRVRRPTVPRARSAEDHTDSPARRILSGLKKSDRPDDRPRFMAA